MDTKLQISNSTKPKRTKVSQLLSILDAYYYIRPNIGPLLGLKNLLKPFIRDIPAVKNYIKYKYEKQKKKREEEIRATLAEYKQEGVSHCRYEFCEKKFIQEWMATTQYNPDAYCKLVKLLHSAVKRGLVDIVKYIIDIDPMLIHSRDEYGNNLATLAILHLNVFKYIVTHPSGTGLKKTVKYYETEESTLLIYALRRKSLYVAKWIIEYVVELWSQNKENLKKYAHIEVSLDTYLNCIIPRMDTCSMDDIYETALNIILKSFENGPFFGFEFARWNKLHHSLSHDEEYIKNMLDENIYISQIINSYQKDVLSLALPDAVTIEEDGRYRQVNCSLDMVKSSLECITSASGSYDEVLTQYIRVFKIIVSKRLQQKDNMTFEDGEFVIEPGFWDRDKKWTRQYPSEDSDKILRYYSDEEDTTIFWPSIASTLSSRGNCLLQYIGLKVYTLCKDIVKLLIQHGAKIPREKINTFHYITKWFDDLEFETYINIRDDGMAGGQIDEREFHTKFSIESYSYSDRRF